MQVFWGSYSPYILGDATRPGRVTCVLVWSESDRRRLRKALHKQTNRQTNRHCENNGHLAVNQNVVLPRLCLGFVYGAVVGGSETRRVEFSGKNDRTISHSATSCGSRKALYVLSSPSAVQGKPLPKLIHVHFQLVEVISWKHFFVKNETLSHNTVGSVHVPHLVLRGQLFNAIS